jgi:hypothetical protein
MKKTRYYYYVKEGFNDDHGLYLGRPDKSHRGAVKYVYKKDKDAVEDYENAKVEYKDCLKEYKSLKVKVSRINSKINNLAAQKLKYLSKIKK